MTQSSLQYIPLDPDLFARYASDYVPPFLKEYQFDIETDSGWIVTNDSDAVGFIWSRRFEIDGKILRSVWHLEVVDAYRNSGIGTELLRRFQTASSNGDKCDFSVIANEQSHGPALRVLEKNGWGKPEISSYCYRTTVDKFFESVPWASKDREYRYQQYLFPWTELTSDERKQLEDEEGPGSWRDEPSPSSPFVFEMNFEPNTSLGVRIRGEIVGWNINIIYGPDTVLYGRYFVRKKYRNTGMAIALLLESLKRQRAAGIRNCVWFTQKHNKKAKQLYDKILAPCILSRNEVYTAEKILQDS